MNEIFLLNNFEREIKVSASFLSSEVVSKHYCDVIFPYKFMTYFLDMLFHNFQKETIMFTNDSNFWRHSMLIDYTFTMKENNHHNLSSKFDLSDFRRRSVLLVWPLLSIEKHRIYIRNSLKYFVWTINKCLPLNKENYIIQNF